MQRPDCHALSRWRHRPVIVRQPEKSNFPRSSFQGTEQAACACPPVVEYSREFQAQAAEELAVLPNGSAVVEMLADYAVMREQARNTSSSCRGSSGEALTPLDYIAKRTA
nr:hypothetical protein [Rhodovulum visakhapatnamense]